MIMNVKELNENGKLLSSLTKVLPDISDDNECQRTTQIGNVKFSFENRGILLILLISAYLLQPVRYDMMSMSVCTRKQQERSFNQKLLY